MNEQQRYLLLGNRKAISKDLLVGDVFSYLQSKLVIEYEDVEKIKLLATSRDKAEKLLDILLNKEKNTFNQFYNALKYAEYDHLADLLENGISTMENSSRDDFSDDSSDDEDELPDIQTILKDGGVPKIPQVFVERPECLQDLHKALYELRNEDGWVVLHGMAGSGKTVLAAHVLQNEELVHSCFPRGIFWVVVGRVDEARLLMKIQNLCSWLDKDQDYPLPKNLEEARDRLRILFAHEHPRSLLVLDDVWSEDVAKYFDVRVRTLVTTRYSGIANKINGNVIKVAISDSFNLQQSLEILSKWTNVDVNNLPVEANSIVTACKGSPLAIAMIGALLRNHNNRWKYYLKELNEQHTSKVKSKLAYQYSSLYDAVAVSYDDLTNELKSHYLMLSVFEEDVPIPLSVLSVYFDMEDVDVEDMMDELIDRSLVLNNEVFEKQTYQIHDIQLSFIKEKATKEEKIIKYHEQLVDRYRSHCNGKFHTLERDHYIHFFLISHMVQAGKIQSAVDLLLDFCWIEISASVTGPAALISSYQDVIKKVESNPEYKNCLPELDELCRLVSTQSNILTTEKNIDFAQLALSRPISQLVYKLALKHIQNFQHRKKTIYYEWMNRPKHIGKGLLLTSQLHSGPVNSCQISHTQENELIVTGGSDHIIRVWYAENGEETLQLEGHKDSVTYCEFSPDDTKIISCSADKTIKVWSASSGQQLLSLQGHTSDVLCCKCSPNGKYIISSAMDNLIKIWELETGQLMFTLDEHTDVVNWCCFSPDNTLVASVSNDLFLKIWNVTEYQCRLTLGGDLDFLLYCIFTNDSKKILTCSQNYVQMHSVNDGSFLWRLDTPADVLSLSLSPNGKYLALAHNDTYARLFDLENEVFVQLFAGHSSWLNDVCFNANGKKIVTTSYDGVCKIWEINPSIYTTEKLRKVFDATIHDKGDNYNVVAATNKNQLRLIKEKKDFIESEKLDSRISVCTISHDGTLVTIGLHNGTIGIFETNTMSRRFTKQYHDSKINCLCYSPSDDLLVSGSEDTICIVLDTRTGNPITKYHGHAEMITECFFYNHNKQKVVSTSFDSYLKVWNSSTGKEFFSCHDDNNSDAILACSISYDDEYLVSCSSFKNCHLWSAVDGQLIMKVDDLRDTLRCVRFSNDNKLFAVGADNGIVKVWRVDNSVPLCTCEPRNGDDMWIMDVRFNKGNNMIVTASNNIKWFDLEGNHLQTYHIVGSYLRSINCTEDFKTCITVDDLGFLYILKQVEFDE